MNNGPSQDADLDPVAQTQYGRLMSALVLLLGLSVFLALPFVLSIGSVVFLPLVAALMLTIMMSPLADRLMAFGLPNSLASIGSLLVFLCVLIAALALIIQPAILLFDTLPAIVERVGERFDALRDDFAWIAAINAQIGNAMGDSGASQVVIATPTMLEEIAFATPSVLIEALIMFLMAYFMIEARVRMRRRLLFDRDSIGASVKAARAIRAVQDKVAAYILTVSMINAGLGVLVALGAWVLGLEAPIMWGGLAMILNFVPYVGPMAMTALLALFGLGTAETIWIGLSYAAAYLALNARGKYCHTIRAGQTLCNEPGHDPHRTVLLYLDLGRGGGIVIGADLAHADIAVRPYRAAEYCRLYVRRTIISGRNAGRP